MTSEELAALIQQNVGQGNWGRAAIAAALDAHDISLAAQVSKAEFDRGFQVGFCEATMPEYVQSRSGDWPKARAAYDAAIAQAAEERTREIVEMALDLKIDWTHGVAEAVADVAAAIRARWPEKRHD